MRHAIRDAKGRFCKAETTVEKDVKNPTEKITGYKVFRKSEFDSGKYRVGDIVTQHYNEAHDHRCLYVYKTPARALEAEYLISSTGDLAVLCKVTVLGEVHTRCEGDIWTDRLSIDDVVSYAELTKDDLNNHDFKVIIDTEKYSTSSVSARCVIAQLNDYSAHTTFNCAKQYIGGDYSTAVACDSYSTLVSKGHDNILAGLGKENQVMGKKGNVLMLVEYAKKGFKIKHCFAGIVDGKKIKEDTWYTLKNGKLVEVK